VRPVIAEILAELLARHRGTGRVHLDDLSEVIGVRAVTQDEIEHLVSRLEAEGLRVGEALDDRDIGDLRAVLASARRLGATLGRRPSVDEIAGDVGLPDHAVRRALDHAGRARPVGWKPAG
jgi:Sigma-70 region 3